MYTIGASFARRYATFGGFVKARITKKARKTAGFIVTVISMNVAGQIWSARSAHDVVIPRETEVRVLKISGVKVLVEAI